MPGRLRGAAGFGMATLILAVVLMQPNHPGAATWGALRVFPLELPAIVLALVLARGAASRILRRLVTAGLAVMVALKAADLASNIAFERAYNPVFDFNLAVAGWRLLTGSIGAIPALGAVLALVGALALVLLALRWATGRIAALDPPRGARAPLGLALAAALGVVAADAAREASPVDPPGAAFTARLAWEHLRDIADARADIAAFRRAAAEDPLASLPPGRILPALRGTDVHLVFVESYGRATLEAPPFAPTVLSALRDIEADLSAAGLAMRSGYLASPTVGGQSWLAHTTLLSGLRIDNQGRHSALFASPRQTLISLAGTAGWRTVAVMPAITLDWPEANWFGYDRVLDAENLGYAGLPFNWVTMPDQFTLASFERAELAAADRPPVFAEIALISSHAPWTPVPRLLPWNALGDGRVFDAMASEGPSPEDVWSDLDRVRAQFARSLDYSLRTVGAFTVRRAARGLDRATLMIVLGDHQPASFVSLDATGRDVPVHVIGPPEIVAQLDAWGWAPGMRPGSDGTVRGMEEFRDRFVTAFGPGTGAVCLISTALPAAGAC